MRVDFTIRISAETSQSGVHRVIYFVFSEICGCNYSNAFRKIVSLAMTNVEVINIYQ